MLIGVIQDLGGTAKLASDLGIKANVVNNWKKRGIARHWRPTIAELAIERGITLPADFLKPKGREKAGVKLRVVE